MSLTFKNAPFVCTNIYTPINHNSALTKNHAPDFWTYYAYADACQERFCSRHTTRAIKSLV